MCATSGFRLPDESSTADRRGDLVASPNAVDPHREAQQLVCLDLLAVVLPMVDRGGRLEGGYGVGEHSAEVLREAVEDHLAALGVGHLAAAEHDRDLDLVAPAQEALDVAALGLVVVLGDLRPELDLADVDLLLVLSRRLRLLLLLVLVLRVVEQPGHRRTGVGGHLDQVEVALRRQGERLLGGDDAHLVSLLVDEPHLRHTDPLVDPRRVTLRRRPVEARVRH